MAVARLAYNLTCRHLRVLSLLPASTEIIACLGPAARLVGVSHECDWPESVRTLPRVTRSAVTDARAGTVDAEVRERSERGAPLFELLEERIRVLHPDIIVTQALCHVCAVSEDDVRALAERLDPAPRVVTFAGATLEGVLADIAFLSGALGCADAGQRLLAALRERMRVVHETLRAARAPRPRVAVIEWTDPPYSAGHWVPDIIRRAGGVDAIAQAGDRSRTIDAAEVESRTPDLLIVAPCGYPAERAAAAARELLALPEWAWARSVPVWAMDGNSLLSRGGPRLIEGVEEMARVMHPGLFGAPGTGSIRITDGSETTTELAPYISDERAVFIGAPSGGIAELRPVSPAIARPRLPTSSLLTDG